MFLEVQIEDQNTFVSFGLSMNLKAFSRFHQHLPSKMYFEALCSLSLASVAPSFHSLTSTNTPNLLQSAAFIPSNEAWVCVVPREAGKEWLSFIGFVWAALGDRELTETSSCQTHWLCDGLSVRQSERTPRIDCHLHERHTHCIFFSQYKILGNCLLNKLKTSYHFSTSFFSSWHIYVAQLGALFGPNTACKAFIYFSLSQSRLKTVALWVGGSVLHRASRKNGLKGSIIALFHALPCVCQKYPCWWIGRRNLRLVKAACSGPDIL